VNDRSVPFTDAETLQRFLDYTSLMDKFAERSLTRYDATKACDSIRHHASQVRRPCTRWSRGRRVTARALHPVIAYLVVAFGS